MNTTTRETTAAEVPEALMAEMRLLKGYFPFRIVYGASKGADVLHGAVVTRSKPNRLAREGWKVWIM